MKPGDMGSPLLSSPPPPPPHCGLPPPGLAGRRGRQPPPSPAGAGRGSALTKTRQNEAHEPRRVGTSAPGLAPAPEACAACVSVVDNQLPGADGEGLGRGAKLPAGTAAGTAAECPAPTRPAASTRNSHDPVSARTPSMWL